MFRTLIVSLMLSLIIAATASAQQRGTPKRSEAAALPPLSVLSIIPAQGEPGMTVTLNGTGFTAGTTAFLGNRQVAATAAVGGRIVSIEIPDLPPGVYALYLKREDGSTSRAYNFVLQAQKPVASSLSPDTVTSCASGREREVTVNGANFREGARVILDGAAVTTRYLSPAAVSFIAPALTPGLHQVQVKNPSDAASGVLALFLDAKPEIGGVAVGREFVNYYELSVTGRNFQQTSVLVVDGNRIATGKQVVGERDELIYAGCSQLVYYRHPYDPTLKEIRLQVVNQNGEESGVFTINAP